MRKQRMPKGWTQEQIRALAAYHDNLTVDEQVTEIEAALANEEQNGGPHGAGSPDRKIDQQEKACLNPSARMKT
jgi:hypothetical protein